MVSGSVWKLSKRNGNRPDWCEFRLGSRESRRQLVLSRRESVLGVSRHLFAVRSCQSLGVSGCQAVITVCAFTALCKNFNSSIKKFARSAASMFCPNPPAAMKFLSRISGFVGAGREMSKIPAKPLKIYSSSFSSTIFACRFSCLMPTRRRR